tara:strand:+ start:1905 stop:2099 length:195 start_codon:yes stop_codon:yes gene_type:complete
MGTREEQFEEFHDRCRTRMRQGLWEYGDKSFSADPAELQEEIKQELEDVANWAFILWCRIQALS